ncbi:hypothetical protein N6L26_02955 [Qipengyuania sp. SS22]|uniref:hypothetical protein n=1 Tax=Qipengyuania sp. SS22 TaxID=2979461 RepID=UPI0021E5AC48|nr:hypothetical protein [Qipengyuania sp. SS22]UYH55540.1 hypothetical protein N6L26_02955 [Qipengyuania sp. SS22]
MDLVPFRLKPPLVADASVWINLVASGLATDVLRALPTPTMIPRIALNELKRGQEKGHSAYAGVTPLIAEGHAAVIDLPEEAEDTYLNLVAGPARQTLDDGEAATLALALHFGATALIDERKAISIAAAQYPDLIVATTTDVLFRTNVRSTLDEATFATGLFAALTQARMRVPEHLLVQVCACLGSERAQLCLSLPARIRGDMMKKGAKAYRA